MAQNVELNRTRLAVIHKLGVLGVMWFHNQFRARSSKPLGAPGGTNMLSFPGGVRVLHVS